MRIDDPFQSLGGQLQESIILDEQQYRAQQQERKESAAAAFGKQSSNKNGGDDFDLGGFGNATVKSEGEASDNGISSNPELDQDPLGLRKNPLGYSEYAVEEQEQ